MSTYIYSVFGDITAGAVHLDALKDQINDSLTGLDYLHVRGDVLEIFFISSLSAGDKTTLDGIVQAHTANPVINVTLSIESAKLFFDKLSTEFAAENVVLGITQAGKTKDVIDFSGKLFTYGQTGSLYEVIAEIDFLLTQDMTGLDPFITTARLNAFKAKVQEYLGI